MCVSKLKIASYARVSYDEDKERYESIINQKNIIRDYAEEHFRNYEIIEFEDDNYSGYKFDRPDFTRMKQQVLDGDIDIVIAKDLSRIGRHNAKTLLFIEEMEQLDVTVIAINDDLDTSQNNNNDIVGIKTLYNELYVKDISRKIRSTVENKSKNGTWITNVPYGYVMMDYQNREYKVDESAAEVVRDIYEMYVNGSGYKKIAKKLTEDKVPTPKARLKQLMEEQGKTYDGEVGEEWNTVSVSHILENDFYIGTLRTNKYTRKGINGIDKKLPEEENYVFQDFHEPILTPELFDKAQETHKSRTNEKTHYRGKKKYANDYTGLMRCGDCGAPMFSISNGKRKPAYYCGGYHNHGKAVCTSHHILVSVLDNLVKEYIMMIKNNASNVIDYLNNELEKNRRKTISNKNNRDMTETLKQELNKAKNELKVTMQQKIRDIMKNTENREYIEEMYATMENELNNKITMLNTQIENEEKNKAKKQNIIKAKKDALKIFDDILNKEKLDKKDLETIIDCIYVYEDKIIIKLKSNIENMLDLGNQLGFSRKNITAIQKNKNHNDRKFFTQVKKGQNCSNVVNNGDPLEIFTDREGQVILKKYSPIGELSEFATGYAETLAKTTGHIACITDKDTIIAVSGGSKKEFLEQDVSQELEKLMEDKEVYTSKENSDMAMPITKNDTNEKKNKSQIVYPIISNGDTIGTVILMSKDSNTKMNEVEKKVAQSAATFLASQMEI